MNKTKLPTLKPCPFCGGSAQYITIETAGTNSSDPGMFVSCTSCQRVDTRIARHKNIETAGQLAADNWNRRKDR